MIETMKMMNHAIIGRMRIIHDMLESLKISGIRTKYSKRIDNIINNLKAMNADDPLCFNFIVENMRARIINMLMEVNTNELMHALDFIDKASCQPLAHHAFMMYKHHGNPMSFNDFLMAFNGTMFPFNEEESLAWIPLRIRETAYNSSFPCVHEFISMYELKTRLKETSINNKIDSIERMYKNDDDARFNYNYQTSWKIMVDANINRTAGLHAVRTMIDVMHAYESINSMLDNIIAMNDSDYNPIMILNMLSQSFYSPSLRIMHKIDLFNTAFIDRALSFDWTHADMNALVLSDEMIKAIQTTNNNDVLYAIMDSCMNENDFIAFNRIISILMSALNGDEYDLNAPLTTIIADWDMPDEYLIETMRMVV